MVLHYNQITNVHFEDLKKNNNNIKLHLTGPLQSNKVKQALHLFDVFHTLDREKLAKELRNACVFHADLSDPASILPLYDQMRTQFGPPTTLVLNAGDRDLYGSAAGEDFQQFARHLSVQLESSHVLVSAALPHMKDMGRGEIIAKHDAPLINELYILLIFHNAI